MDFFLELDKIESPKTKEYFKEVISSYANGNYRSAIVMLYIVTVTDLMYKLQELDELYNDSTARKILADLEKNRTSKSSWENTLIDKILNIFATKTSFTNNHYIQDYWSEIWIYAKVKLPSDIDMSQYSFHTITNETPAQTE